MKKKVAWNILYSYYMWQMLIFFILCHSIPFPKKIKSWSWSNMLHLSGKFSLIRFFFKMCLKGSLPNSLTSEEVRQLWTTQKLSKSLTWMKTPTLPTRIGFYYQSTSSKLCFTSACHVTFGQPRINPIDMNLSLAESFENGICPNISICVLRESISDFFYFKQWRMCFCILRQFLSPLIANSFGAIGRHLVKSHYKMSYSNI